LFLISQGASKVAYYIGSILLLFVPGVGLVRGGLSWMLSSLYVPYGPRLYWLVIAAIGLCGAASLGVLMGCVRMATRAVSRINPKPMAVAAMCIAASIAFGFTGINGLLVMVVATCIGCIPVFVGGRRMNCLGIILLPITLNVIGVGADVARWLGLL
jgi:TctA family transporter